MRASQPILVVVHQETSNVGLVGDLLRSQGYTLDVRCPALDQPLPTHMEDHAAAIVFGGPMSANDSDTLPFIQAELDWIPTVLESGKPYLGICLGAQLLARVLGATVAPHPEGMREIGYFAIAPTAEGHVHFTQPMHVYQWHKEGFDLPSGATLLAQGDTFANQAFRYGQSAYGVQFHPEMTADIMTQWTTNGAEQLTLPGAQSVAEQIRHHQAHGPAVQRWTHQFLQSWMRTVLHVG